jgi:hypothetical protein
MAKNKVTKNTKGLDALVKRVTPLSKYEAHVGILASKGGTTAHVGAASKGQTITLLELAAIHEFGSPKANIPERSFIRSTFNNPAGQEELKRVYAKLAKAVMNGKMTAEKALELLGMQAMVKNTILSGEGVPPPNAISTIIAKGSSRPLVDTGQLVGSITYEVRAKKK